MSCLWRIYGMFMANLCRVYGEFMSCLWRIFHVYCKFMSCLWRIYVTGNTKSVHVKFPVIFSILTKYGVPRHIVIEVPDIKFHGNPPSGNRADTCEQTDGHDESSGRFSRL